MKVLILEDDENRHRIFKQNLAEHELTITEFAEEAIKLLETEGPWDALFLDHDLGGQVYVESGPGTGYEVAEWLGNPENEKYMPAEVFIHTLNPAGQAKMMLALPKAKATPFIMLFPQKESY